MPTIDPYQAYRAKQRQDALDRQRESEGAIARFDLGATQRKNAFDFSLGGMTDPTARAAGANRLAFDDLTARTGFDAQQQTDQRAYDATRQDADFSEQQRSQNQQAPSPTFTPTAPQAGGMAPTGSFAGTGQQGQQALRASGSVPGTPGYIEARAVDRGGANQRNNFAGAESAPEGSVVRGIDKLLYRRTGGNFVRVPPRSADDFEPAAPTTQAPAADELSRQQTRYQMDVGTFGRGIADRNRQNAGFNGPTATAGGGPIGAVNNPQQFDAGDSLTPQIEANQQEMARRMQAARTWQPGPAQRRVIPNPPRGYSYG